MAVEEMPDTAQGIDLTPDQDGGVLKEILKPGVGDECPCSGNKVKVHYVGKLLDGSEFDSSRSRGEPFEFNLGKGSVIKAWDLGVATMRRGELALLTCKPEYAYGKTGSPPKIGPDATLLFEIEMLDWSGEDLSKKKDGGVTRYQINKGEGYATPNDGAIVDVHLIGKYNDTVFEERDVTFPLGEGSEQGVCEGLELAIEKFKKGEKSRILLKSKYAFKDVGKPECNVPPNADVEYVVELNNFEKAKESWSLDSDGKLEQAKFFKEKGTNYFKVGKYQLALKMYKKIVSFLEHSTGFEGAQEEERKNVLLSGHLNMAMCHLKLSDFLAARDHCDKALELDPINIKALFRRGQAWLGIVEPEKAKADFEAAHKLEPENKAIAGLIAQCNAKLKEQKSREKKIYANMFEKFAQRDREDPKKSLYGWWDESEGKVVVEDINVEVEKQKKKPFKLPLISEREHAQAEERKEKSGREEVVSAGEKEEEWRRNQPDVMKTLGEWGKDEREREMTDFERENPNILMLNSTGEEFKNM